IGRCGCPSNIVTFRPDPGRLPAVFLDRDGTIIEDVGYLRHLDQIVFFPWSIDAIRALNRAGLPVVVITNQSGIARGILTEAFVDETHRRIAEQVAAGAARIDAYYYCPHHPQGKVETYVQACHCSKPGCRMAERRERLLGLVDRFSSRRILVVGDLIADEFIYGDVARVSREAPVLILKYDATEIVGGGAANAANNVAALGGRSRLVGIVGDDVEGRRLIGSFHRGVERTHVIRSRGYRTPVKTRILAGGVHAARQQVVR